MRVWGKPEGKHYIRRNKRTGRVKYFKTYKEMLEWAIKLPLKKYYEWCTWEYQD